MPIATHETHELNVPVTHQGQEYTELRIRRPKAKDILRGLKRDLIPFEDDMQQLVDLCEVPPEVIDGLDVSDIFALQAIMRSFAAASEGDVRKAILILSTRVGWDLDTLENRPVDDIIEWLKTLEAISRN